MKKIICDICDNEILLREDFIQGFDFINRRWEFCEECENKIRKFIKNLKKTYKDGD